MKRWTITGMILIAGCVTPPPEEPAPPPPSVAKPVEPPPAPQVREPETEARVEPTIIAPPLEPPPRPRSDDVERLLVYFEHVRKLPAAELSRENETARTAFNRSRSDFDRMRLAMLLSVPNTAIADEQRAYDLLDPVVKNPSSPLYGLALLMTTHLQERRRLESNMQQLQQNVQGLQNKLDALMSLERTLIDRDKSPPPRKR